MNSIYYDKGQILSYKAFFNMTIDDTTSHTYSATGDYMVRCDGTTKSTQKP